AALTSIAEALRQPAERWFAAWFRGARALSSGDFPTAERIIAEVRALGTRAHPGAVLAANGLAMVLAHERGEWADFERGFEPFLVHYPGAERLRRVGVALACTEHGALDEARREFEALAARDFTDFARDEHWLLVMVQLVGICSQLGDARRASALYAQLEP